jgi:PPOX class probable F420-dependent enzyme
MLSSRPGLNEAIDRALIGFLTAVNDAGQPQASPVWFLRDGDDVIVYNKPVAKRLESIASNPRVAFSLRGDREGHAGVTLEGMAVVEESLPPAHLFPGYVDKYASEIANLGWTPESFAADYSVGVRVSVTRVRAFGLERLTEGDPT